MQRLHERFEEEEYRASAARHTPELKKEREHLVYNINVIIENIETMQWHKAKQLADNMAQEIEDVAQPLRQSIMTSIGSGQIGVPEGTSRVEAIRWMRRVSKHISRICNRLNEVATSAGK